MLKQAVKRCGGLIDYINSQPGWNAMLTVTEDKTINIQGPAPGDDRLSTRELEFINANPNWEVCDCLSNTVVRYYPLCDCGKPTMERVNIPVDPLCFASSEYMETCYECGVVSSD